MHDCGHYDREEMRLSFKTLLPILQFGAFSKIRSFKWILAFCGIRNELEVLWRVYRVGAFRLNYEKSDDQGPLWWDVKYKGFTNGTWKKLDNGLVSSGIACLLLGNSRKLIFTFSGTTAATCLLEVEIQAMIFLYNQFKISPIWKSSLQIYTDSMILSRV